MKKMMSVCLAALFVAGLCACAEKETEKSEKTSVTTPEAVVTTVSTPVTTASVATTVATKATTVASTALKTTAATVATTAASKTMTYASLESKATTVPTRIDQTVYVETTTESETTTAATTKTIVSEDPSAVSMFYVVYLPSGSDTVLEMEADAKKMSVKATVPARFINGMYFGYISYAYDPSDAKTDLSTMKTDIPESSFYLVNGLGEIQKELGSLYATTEKTVTGTDIVDMVSYDYEYTVPSVSPALSNLFFSQMTITSVENGKILATIGEKKNVDITDKKVSFFYTDIDGKSFYEANDTAAVALYAFDDVTDMLAPYYKKAALAKAVWQTLASLDATEYRETCENAKADYEACVTALEAQKEAVADKYFNGWFWGSGALEDSPLAAYFTKVAVMEHRKASVSFWYAETAEELYVLVPTFVLG